MVSGVAFWLAPAGVATGIGAEVAREFAGARPSNKAMTAPVITLGANLVVVVLFGMATLHASACSANNRPPLTISAPWFRVRRIERRLERCVMLSCELRECP